MGTMEGRGAGDVLHPREGGERHARPTQGKTTSQGGHEQEILPRRMPGQLGHISVESP